MNKVSTEPFNGNLENTNRFSNTKGGNREMDQFYTTSQV